MDCRLALTFALLAFAPRARGAEVRVDGSYRLRYALDSDLALDEEPFRLGQTRWAEHRLRLSPKIVDAGRLEILASFDVLSGLVGGQLAPGFQGLGWTERSERNGTRARGFDFRHLFVEGQLPAGLFRVGQMPNDWGMGLWMNGGEEEHATDFGDARFGDIVDRILFSTRPFGFLGPHSGFARAASLALAADLVYRDRFARLVLRDGGGLQWGDLAVELVSQLLWDPSHGTRVGLHVSRRIQSYAKDQGSLHVWAFDLHARTLLESSLLGGSTLSLEGEAVEVVGGTSHARIGIAPGSTRVAQQGGALRATLSVRELESELELGYASGDGNPFDDASHAFSFNRDYKVSLVLFDELLLFQTQNAARRLSSPALFGRPPAGVDLVPSEGAVTDALYLKPTLRYRPGALGGKVRVVGNALFARAPQPFLDPYRSLLASAPVNAFGAPAGKNYGVELDLGASLRQRLADTAGVELGIQAGLLFPGNAFDRADGTRMGRAYAAKLRATFFF